MTLRLERDQGYDVEDLDAIQRWGMRLHMN